MKKLTCVFIAVFMMGFVFFSAVSAEKPDTDLICKYAAEDADYYLSENMLTWVAGGCLLGPLGMFMAVLPAGKVPSSRIIGKNPEYVLQYTKCYSDKIGIWPGFITGLSCGFWSAGVTMVTIIAVNLIGK